MSLWLPFFEFSGSLSSYFAIIDLAFLSSRLCTIIYLFIFSFQNASLDRCEIKAKQNQRWISNEICILLFLWISPTSATTSSVLMLLLWRSLQKTQAPTQRRNMQCRSQKHDAFRQNIKYFFPPLFFFPFWEISFIHWQRHLNRYFLTEAFIPLLWEGKPCILLAKLSYNVSAKPKEIWVFKELFQAGNIRHWEWELLSGSCLGDKFPWQTAPEDNSETQGGLSGCLWQNAEGRVQDKRNLPSASQQAKIPQRGKASSTEISSVLLFRSRVQSTASVC